MDTIEIKILNPKANKLIKNLEDLKLISIRKSSSNEFIKVLGKIRKKSKTPPSLDDITTEVESVRSKRYAGKS